MIHVVFEEIGVFATALVGAIALLCASGFLSIQIGLWPD